MPGNVTELPAKRGKKPQKEPEAMPESDPRAVPVATERFPPWPRGKGKGNFATAEEVIAYWQSLAGKFINRTNFYVNREKPVLDRLKEYPPDQVREMREHKRRYPAKYIDKPDRPWEPDQEFRMYFLERYGSGDYKIFLNDAGVTKNKEKDPDLESRNLCKALYSIWDSAYPPILDPSRPDKGLGILDWNHPANASYVGELKMKGIVPPGEKEEEVANEVVKTLVDKVGVLADKVATHEQDRLVERIAEKVNPQGNGQQSMAGTIVDVMRAAKEMNAPPPSAPVAAALSPDAQMAGTLTLVEKIMTMKAENPMVELYKLQLQSTIDEMKEYRNDVRRLQDKLAEKQQENKGDNLESIIDKFEKIAPKIQGLLGLGGDKLTDVVHGRRRGFWEELALKAVEELSPGVNSLLTAGGQFLLAPKGQLQIGPAQQAALPAPNGNAQQPQADPLLPLKQKVGNFLGANLRPLQKHFEAYVKAELRDPDDKESGIQDGSDFAMWIEENHGVDILTDARQLGADQITLMFQSTPAIWAAIKPHEQKFKEFLYQVLAYTPEEGDEGRPVDLTEEK